MRGSSACRCGILSSAWVCPPIANSAPEVQLAGEVARHNHSVFPRMRVYPRASGPEVIGSRKSGVGGVFGFVVPDRVVTDRVEASDSSCLIG
jgi:hypothetical protein